jgi:four helix bundle protein
MIGLSDDSKVSNLVRNYYDLEVYKQAYQISLIIHKSSLEFPKIEQYALADQIRRSSKSICANIAEGFTKQQNSKPEFKRFLFMSLASAHETRVWIDYCQDLGYVDSETAVFWAKQYESISRMLQSFISKI